MARDFNELRNQLSPERQERIDAMAHEMLNPTIKDQEEYREAVRCLADANTRIAQQKVELEETLFVPGRLPQLSGVERPAYLAARRSCSDRHGLNRKACRSGNKNGLRISCPFDPM